MGSQEQLEALLGLAEQEETPRNQSVSSLNEDFPSEPTAKFTDIPCSPQPKSDTESFISAQSSSKVALPSRTESSSKEYSKNTLSKTAELYHRLSFPPRACFQRVSSQNSWHEQARLHYKPGSRLVTDVSSPKSFIEDDPGLFGGSTMDSGRSDKLSTKDVCDIVNDGSPARSQKGRILAAKGLKGIVANAMKRKTASSEEIAEEAKACQQAEGA